MASKLRSAIVRCAVSTFFSVGFPVSGLCAESDTNKTLSLRYEAASGAADAFPDSCGKPYQDVQQFIEFYEATIDSMVVERGPQARGIADLFAISELRGEFKELFPNLSEESPLDRLIIAQLCQYQKIRAAGQVPGSVKALAITSDDPSLHDHLAGVAARLFKDARQIGTDSIAQQAKLKERARLLAAKKADIRKARALGRNRVEDLFDTAEGVKQDKLKN